MADANILDALTLNVKTHGYNYAPGSKLICLSYRIYYKLLTTLNSRCKLYDTSDQTIYSRLILQGLRSLLEDLLDGMKLIFPLHGP